VIELGARPAAGTPALAARDLAIAGLVPLSTVDWPGMLVATVFCQGCPWDCAYCQNAGLIDPTLPGVADWEEAVEPLLARRRGLLDGVGSRAGRRRGRPRCPPRCAVCVTSASPWACTRVAPTHGVWQRCCHWSTG
jgi:Pyruvate-formate lyase-activating enzyme